MSGGYPYPGEWCNGTSVGVSLSTNYGTTVTTGAANTLGSWAQIVASTVGDCSRIVMEVQTSGAWTFFAIQIGVGAAASEVILWNNLFIGTQSGDSTKSIYYFEFPCQIPAGTRIAARAQSEGAADTCYITMQLFDTSYGTPEGVAGVEALGFTAASTTGTTIARAGSTNTKGAYSQIVASTSRDYLGFSIGSSKSNPGGYNGYALDVAIGAGGSEKIIIPDLILQNGSFGVTPPPTVFWVPVPSGTRLSVRLATNGGTTATYDIPIVLHGVF